MQRAQALCDGLTRQAMAGAHTRLLSRTTLAHERWLCQPAGCSLWSLSSSPSALRWTLTQRESLTIKIWFGHSTQAAQSTSACERTGLLTLLLWTSRSMTELPGRTSGLQPLSLRSGRNTGSLSKFNAQHSHRSSQQPSSTSGLRPLILLKQSLGHRRT